MPDITEVQLLRDRLTERLSRLRELHTRGLISQDIFSGQIMEILGSAESRRLWEIAMKPDMTARRLLSRLEDPVRWRRESSMPAEQRLSLLKERLAASIMERSTVDSAVLESLLETASLPHYASFIPSSDSGPRIERTGVELSVLD